MKALLSLTDWKDTDSYGSRTAYIWAGGKNHDPKRNMMLLVCWRHHRYQILSFMTVPKEAYVV